MEATGFENKQLEYQLLKYILCNNNSITSIISKNIFSALPLKDIFTTSDVSKCTLTKDLLIHKIKDSDIFMDSNKKDDVLEVYKRYIDKVYSADIKDIDYKNIEIIIDLLGDLADKRHLFRLVNKWSKDFENLDIKKVKKTLKKFSAERIINHDGLSGNYVDDYKGRVEFIKNKSTSEVSCIPSGIYKFDSHIGGLMLGEFGVLAGRTGLGKTAMLCCIAINAWLNGYNVFFATGEMKRILIQFRMDSNIIGLSSQKLRTGELSKEDFEKWESKVNDLNERLDSFMHVEDFSRGFTCDSIEDKMNRIQDKYKKPVHLLVSDYINIMEPNKSYKGNKQDWGNQGEAVWEFKTTVETFNRTGICGWTGSQIKDEFFDVDKLSLGSLKYARAIENTAPVIMGMVRSEEDILYNTMKVQILKMRNAKVLKEPIILYPNLELMRINNTAEQKIQSLEDLDA